MEILWGWTRFHTFFLHLSTGVWFSILIVSFHTRSRLRPCVYFNCIKIITDFLGLVFVRQRTQEFALYLRVLYEGRHQWPSSKAWVSCNSLAGIAGSKPAGCMDVCLMGLCCQVDVSATSWSLVQRSPTECGVSECDCEASVMRRPCPSNGLLRHEGGDYEVNGPYCEKCLLDYF
jgi:hypothetical protein